MVLNGKRSDKNIYLPELLYRVNAILIRIPKRGFDFVWELNKVILKRTIEE